MKRKISDLKFIGIGVFVLMVFGCSPDIGSSPEGLTKISSDTLGPQLEKYADKNCKIIFATPACLAGINEGVGESICDLRHAKRLTTFGELFSPGAASIKSAAARNWIDANSFDFTIQIDKDTCIAHAGSQDDAWQKLTKAKLGEQELTRLLDIVACQSFGVKCR